MSPENIPPPENKATTNGGGTRKTTNQRPPDPPQQPPLKCPRCDSSNTKFCYYNNYSLTQPRHFCKTCRRYWTRGGALRNVPIGGGCRKSKKLRSSSSTTISSKLLSLPGEEFRGVEFGSGFKFLGSNSGGTPPMEFQLGGLALPRLHPATAGVYTQFIASSGASGPGTGLGFGLDLLSLNYPINAPTMSCGTQSLLHAATPITTTTPEQPQQQAISISSIESLSSINQEMHWKLQQQRLSMIYGPSSQDDDTDTKINTTTNHHHQEKTHEGGGGGAIDLFKNLEMNNNNNNENNNNNSVGNKVGPTEWLFSPANYGANHDNNITTSMSMGVTTSCNSVHEGIGGNLSGIWGHELHHDHHQQQVQFNGLQ